MSQISVGSVCSGIEAASVAWEPLDFQFKWFSEIADFPSRLLHEKYPQVPNLGNMCDIPEKIESLEVAAPDLICGGTPCQAFSLAGWKKGLEDSRGNLTLKFVDIVEKNDLVRSQSGLPPSIVLWENVEGVLKDKTNAFGIFLSSLAGLESEMNLNKWPRAGLVRGPKRNVAWRVLDAKYFGLPQQRRRLYVLAGGQDFFPENILFDQISTVKSSKESEAPALTFKKEGHSIEVFRSYTDCLYSAYGTKWNGNAAAYNGSLFVSQNGRLRRFTPLECERLMGFPDDYTNVAKAKPTNRYQGVGNSWAVPLIQWIGQRISDYKNNEKPNRSQVPTTVSPIQSADDYQLFDMASMSLSLENPGGLNGSVSPENIETGNLYDVIDVNAAENFYISPAGCKGILRRKEERKLTINSRLEAVLRSIAAQWSDEKIEKISRVQSRGRFSAPNPAVEEADQVL